MVTLETGNALLLVAPRTVGRAGQTAGSRQVAPLSAALAKTDVAGATGKAGGGALGALPIDEGEPLLALEAAGTIAESATVTAGSTFVTSLVVTYCTVLAAGHVNRAVQAAGH